jgi:hypothetical protein
MLKTLPANPSFFVAEWRGALIVRLASWVT